MLHFTETRRVMGRQRRFRAHFQTLWAPSFTAIRKLYNQFNIDGSILVMKLSRLHLCIIRRTLTLSEWP
jgi:hypothetical protein